MHSTVEVRSVNSGLMAMGPQRGLTFPNVLHVGRSKKRKKEKILTALWSIQNDIHETMTIMKHGT
jgi:hypothetical protein